MKKVTSQTIKEQKGGEMAYLIDKKYNFLIIQDEKCHFSLR